MGRFLNATLMSLNMPTKYVTFNEFVIPIKNTFSKLGFPSILQEKNDRKLRRIEAFLIILTIFNSAYSIIAFSIVISDFNIKLDDKIEVFACGLTNLLGVSKVVSLYMKKDQLASILRTFESQWPAFEKPLEKKAYKLIIKPIIRSTLVYGSVVIFSPLIFVLLPIYDKLKNDIWRLPFQAYYPFEWKDSVGFYVLCYIQQIHVAFVTGYSMTAYDCLLLLCLGCINMHLNILSNNFKHANLKDGDLKIVEANLHDLYRRHVEILRLVRSIQDLFSASLAAVFFINSFILCVLMFVLTIAPAIHLPKFVEFIMAIFLQTLLICWFGDQLTEQASKVGSGAYLCKWRTLPPWCRKDLAFVIMRANKPLRLQGGPIANATLTTFTSIMSSSWTYFNLVRMLFGKKSGHGLAKA